MGISKDLVFLVSISLAPTSETAHKDAPIPAQMFVRLEEVKQKTSIIVGLFTSGGGRDFCFENFQRVLDRRVGQERLLGQARRRRRGLAGCGGCGVDRHRRWLGA